MTDLDRFNLFVGLMRKHYPNLKIAYKDESLFMKILSKIMFFNKSFATDFITTIGDTVYYPSRAWVEEKPVNAMNVLAHECVHIKDSHKFSSPIFKLMYMAPQVFALLLIPAFFLIGWWALLFLLFLAPIPSPGRMYFERRGYTMTLFMLDRRLQEFGLPDGSRADMLNKTAENIDKKYFTGSAYYFMWPFGMETKFAEAIKSIISGDILDSDEVFRFVDAALTKSKS